MAVYGLNEISNIPSGTLNAPSSGTVSISEVRVGPLYSSTFTLTAARIPVTDAAGSGSYGSLLLYTLPAGMIGNQGFRMNYTSFVEGAALTGGAGDASFNIGIGTTAIATPRNGTLVNTEKDVTDQVAITLSGGTGTGSLSYGAGNFVETYDGTSSAVSFYLNWSGTAATIDANSYIDVTGTITIAWLNLGDD